MDTLRHSARGVAETAQNAWDTAREGAQQAFSSVTSRDIWENLGDVIQRYPIASVLVGMGVGFCLGRMLETRSLPNRMSHSSGPPCNPTNVGM
jgi:hypothetical protein